MSTARDRRKDPRRVAMISVHTAPGDQPGVGDAGGMNVYILSVARRLAEQGIAVDVFTRSKGGDSPQVNHFGPGTRVIQVPAGPRRPVKKDDLPGLLPGFLGGVLAQAVGEDRPGAHPQYDIVHSHYWLSGWVGTHAKRIWGAPHVASFHTLGKVKNASASADGRAEPHVRLAGEDRVVRRADRIVAPTSTEANHLIDLYGADPAHIRIVEPGVDRKIFAPIPKKQARERLGLRERRLLLFVGRLQPFKGPDVAIGAFAEAVHRAPELTGDVVLWLVGGPSGDATPDEIDRLKRMALEAGIRNRVSFVPPQPHHALAAFYSAAEVVFVPSRSESFGLTALEAQACGTPVIATASSGLRHVVVDGETGFLVDGWDAVQYSEPLLALLTNPELASRLAVGGTRHASRFSWDATVSGVRDVYRDLLDRGVA